MMIDYLVGQHVGPAAPLAPRPPQAAAATPDSLASAAN
jgi:hypothetical protein